MNMEYFYALPGYEKFVGSEKILLFSRNKIELVPNRYECVSFDFDSIRYINDDNKILEHLRIGSNITSFVFCSIIIILFTVIFFIDICSGQSSKGLFLGANFIYVLTFLILCVVVTILSGIGMNYISAIERSSSSLTELGTSSCFRVEGYNTLFYNFQYHTLNRFNISSGYNKAALGLSITYMCIAVVYLIWKIFKWVIFLFFYYLIRLAILFLSFFVCF